MGAVENRVEKYLNEEAVRLGGKSYKWVSPGCNGVPDRIVIINGVVWFVEVKTLSGDMSGAQARRAKELMLIGANVASVYGKQGVDKFIRMVELKLNKQKLKNKLRK